MLGVAGRRVRKPTVSQLLLCRVCQKGKGLLPRQRAVDKRCTSNRLCLHDRWYAWAVFISTHLTNLSASEALPIFLWYCFRFAPPFFASVICIKGLGGQMGRYRTVIFVQESKPFYARLTKNGEWNWDPSCIVIVSAEWYRSKRNTPILFECTYNVMIMNGNFPTITLMSMFHI